MANWHSTATLLPEKGDWLLELLLLLLLLLLSRPLLELLDSPLLLLELLLGLDSLSPLFKVGANVTVLSTDSNGCGGMRTSESGPHQSECYQSFNPDRAVHLRCVELREMAEREGKEMNEKERKGEIYSGRERGDERNSWPIFIM